MEWSAEQVRPERDDTQPAMALDAKDRPFDPADDPYADAELERRRQRTEHMIQKARRLS